MNTLQKRLLFIVAPLVLILGGAGWAIYSHVRTPAVNPDAVHETTQNPSPKNNNPPTKTDATAGPTTGQTSSQVPVSTAMTANITQLEETNNTVKFAATVQNATSAGTCVVTFSNPNDRPVTQQFAAKNVSNTSTCGPISLSADEFSYLGQWQVSFHYYAGDQQATATSTIIIK